MKNKAFTLIELLAVIIILGILMLIAIPSVTSYINDSRKSTYVSTIQEIIKGASNLVNSGEFDMYDTNTTYYIPVSAIELENGNPKSPYGEFEEAYIVVTYDGEEYDYYFVGKDEKDMGIPLAKSAELIDKDSIKGDINSINTNSGIDGRENIVVFPTDPNENKVDKIASSYVNKDGTQKNVLCKRAKTLHTETCLGNVYYERYCEIDNRHAYGDTITYGNYGEKGVLTTGDAFDCDVNADGTFDAEHERFYYVSSYYDGDSNTFDNNKAVLIFYTGTNNGEISNSTSFGSPYATKSDVLQIDPTADQNAVNWVGPITAYKKLPSSSVWSNELIIKPGKRTIVNEQNNPTAIVKDIINPFDYGDKAARFITYQEITANCKNPTTSGGLDNCEYLFEDTYYSGTGRMGYYWLENPSVYFSSLGQIAWHVETTWVKIQGGAGVTNNYYTVRPAITVLVDNLLY